MELVLDTNILISSLLGTKIKDTLAKTLIAAKLHTTSELLEETERHWDKILRYTRLPHSMLREFYNTIIDLVIIHGVEDIPEDIREKARKLVESADPDDWPFVALAMFLGVPLWTGDRELLRLAVKTGFRYFVAVDTEGVEMLLEGRSLEEVKERMRRKYGRGE